MLLVHPVSTESLTSSSTSELARTLEDETDSLFRFLDTVVPLAELPAACQAGPDASVGAETWVLWFLSYLIRSHTATLAALLRTDEVFTPSEEVQLLKARVEYIYGSYIQRNLTLSFKCRSKRWRSSI